MFVILKYGFEPSDKLAKELKLHIHETLGAIAVPDELAFVLRLPKTRSGKPMRSVLRAICFQREGAE